MSEVETPEVEVEVTMDDLYAAEIDSEAQTKERMELLLPVGTYVTTPPFEFKLDSDKNGRKQARFFGEVVMGDVKGKLGMRVSWVRKNKVVTQNGVETDTGKPDNSYKLYLQASKAFTAAYGREPINAADVITYLRDYPVRLRIIALPDGDSNMVVAISPVRAEQ
jgi:hypothetical protein